MRYRPEVDSIRAIAIIFIILSHFQKLSFVSGGVNIFFVISGYLVTHIFLNQKLHISKFYKTRFLKLYPAVFTISLITLILFFFVGDFVNWTIILRSFASTVLGFFNFYLIYIGDVYGQENYINPFLPFWAFCVIIQFYIIFPIILKFIFFIKSKFNFNDTFIIFTLFTISTIFFLFYYYFRENSLFSFYSPLSRYWQFILGACLYFVIKFKEKLHFNKLTIYLAIILIIIWQLNLEWLYEWRRTQILLTISTVLFLYSTPKGIFNKILSFKPLTSLGKVSFEVYLIHMPIIYFISLWFDQGVIILSLALLFIITYLFIRSFNLYLIHKIIFIFSNKLIIISLSFLILINLGLFFYNENLLLKKEIQLKNFFSLINPIEKTKINFKKYDNSYIHPYSLFLGKDGKSCYGLEGDELLKNCFFFNDIKKNKNFVLLGGSQMASLSYNLKSRLKNYNFFNFTSGGFLYIPNYDLIDKKENKKNKFFREYNTLFRNNLLSVNKKTIVLIGGRFPLYLNQTHFDNKEGGVEGKDWQEKFEHVKNKKKNWQDGFVESIEELLTNNNIKIVLVYPIPEVGFSIKEKLLNHKFFTNKLLDTSFDVFKERTKSSFELLDSIQNDNIYRIYPHKLFCNKTIKNRCVSHNGWDIFYADNNHPSLKGAAMIGDLIMKEIEKIEISNN